MNATNSEETELVISVPAQLSATDMTRVMKSVREVVSEVLGLPFDQVIVSLG